MKFTNKSSKTLITTISILTVSVMILTGTFAWRTIQTALTAGRGINSHYVVQLMDKDYDGESGIYQQNNWVVEDKLDKPVYATSSYLNADVKAEYDGIISNPEYDTPHFSNTWVRIKIEETFILNGAITKELADTLTAEKKLKSSLPGDYFELQNSSDVEIITLAEWKAKIEAEDSDYDYRGRFWVLDESSGWLYWAEPLLAPTVATLEEEDKLQQTTKTIIDKVELKKQPSGSWDYQITSTLEAMDVELQDYNAGKAWLDIADTHDIYKYLLSDSYVPEYDWDGETLMFTANTFPDAAFREYLENETRPDDDNWNISYISVDGKISQDDLDKVTKVEVTFTNIASLKGIQHFKNLMELRARDMLNLTNEGLDVSKNKELTLLWASRNPLISSLDVSENLKLTRLDANGNPLISSLDIRNNDKLTYLSAFGNPLLSELDVSNNAKLTELRVQTNPLLSRLDVIKLADLTVLDVRDSNLTSLTLGDHPNLKTTFRIEGNRLSSLNISGLPLENQSAEERGTGNVFTLNPQYQAAGEKTVGNRRQNAIYDDDTKTLTWEE